MTLGRRIDKRYGIVFSCLESRAIHLEIAHSLSTDYFINIFRGFVARRGNVRQVRSDSGTHLTASDKELRKAVEEWN